jgi:SpoVK/Ycf46/Vps4 family AAA+-type ATPase
MLCKAIVTSTCAKKHKISRQCHDKAHATCKKCEAEVRAQEKRRQRDHQLDEKRQARQRAYAAQLAELADEMEHQKRILKDQADERDQKQAIDQMNQDLRNLKEKAKQPPQQPASTHSSTEHSETVPHNASVSSDHSTTSRAPQASTTGSTTHDQSTAANQSDSEPDWDKSESRDDWAWQKKFEGVENEALDSLVSMIGLESVKQQFLAIKAKVDTTVRQNVSLKGERFGAALLGNPGTGKTTIARLYAQFLVKMGAIPGDHFIETSGSSLANDGVSACKAHIDAILNAGGGVLFVDEVSGSRCHSCQRLTLLGISISIRQ